MADSETVLDYFYPYYNKVIPIYPGDEWYRPAIWIDSSWRIKMRRWVEVHWTSIWTHQDIPVLSTYMRWHYQSSSLWILIALLLKSYSYRDVESCIFRSWREQFVYLELMRYSHTQQLILVPSILQVRRIWPSRCRWWSGRDGSTLHQLIEVDGLCYYLEASRTAEIARYVENDNLADIKLKLTCTNSIAAMNIYMEQMKYHRATEQRAMDCSVKMRRSFFNRI